MLQSPGVELGQAELGLQELSASFPWAPSPLGRSLGPWVSQGGPPQASCRPGVCRLAWGLPVPGAPA